MARAMRIRVVLIHHDGRERSSVAHLTDLDDNGCAIYTTHVPRAMKQGLARIRLPMLPADSRVIVEWSD